MAYPRLFSPITINRLKLKNRLVMPAMGTGYTDANGRVTERLIAYYAARAAGGTGLIIVEVSYVEHPRGKGVDHQLALHDDSLIDGLKKLADAVHRQGAAIAFQLNHAGRRATRAVTGVQPVSSSPIPVPPSEAGWYTKGGDIPKELNAAEIRELVRLYAEAARRAKAAGADAVEVHGAHGYLINQFLSPHSNRRTDDYGGTTEGRTRFAREIVQEVRAAVGKDFPVLFRISAWEGVSGGLELEEAQKIVRILEKAGADAFNVSAGSHDSMYLITPPSYVPLGHIVHLAAGIKEAVGVPVCTVGRINSPELAEQILADGKADLVALGRGLMADPEFGNKAKAGKADEIRHCIWCNQGCVGRLRRFDANDRGMMTCTVNPALGEEGAVDWRPVKNPKKVMVIGGGPGGLEASLTAARKGHRVILYEKETELGGQLRLAYRPPGKGEMESVLTYYRSQLPKHGVEVRLGKEANVATARRVKPDVILVATGGTPLVPEIDGIAQGNVMTAWDVVGGTKQPGKEVVVLGGGAVGCETAHFVAEQDRSRRVTIIEQAGQIAAELEINRRHYLRLNLERSNIRVLTGCCVEKIRRGEIVYRQGDGKTGTIPADSLVLACGAAPFTGPAETLREAGFDVRLIGDCKEARDMLEAIHDGFVAAMSL